ncbi:MAG: AAA family ATPase [Planctomycetota bacterium]
MIEGLLIGIGVLAGYWLGRGSGKAAGAGRAANGSGTDASGASGESSHDRARLYELAAAMDEFYVQSAHPRDLLEQETFQRGVALLGNGGFSTADLVAYYRGDNDIISCMALEALCGRASGSDRDALLAAVNDQTPWVTFFVLRVLGELEEPVLPLLFAAFSVPWRNSHSQQLVVDFVGQRLAGGEPEPAATELDVVPGEIAEWLADALARTDHPPTQQLATAVRRRLRSRVDVGYLRSVGKVWSAADRGDLVEDEPLRRVVDELERNLRRDPPRSLLLVGESGVGKTVALRLLGRRLIAQDWVLFEAGAVELLAGQSYHGQLEDRLQQLAAAIGSGRRVLWIVPDVHELVWAGRHHYSSSSVLDYFLPLIETGAVVLAGEISPESYDRLLQQKPQLRGVTEVVQLAPRSETDTLALATQWVGRQTADGEAAPVPDALLREMAQLAQQYLGDTAPPGNLLRLLELTVQDRARDGVAAAPVTRADLLAVLSRRTGLPRTVLDESEGLELERLRGFFTARVKGQDEGVDCLVERIAMIKAGLTDPGRPLGVFLFCGPTGSGKTELAKALAHYLFGSAERMVRLDMSEFSGPGAQAGVLGDADPRSERRALVHRVREQPFCVVLLDEIEKADTDVFDLFLQVFDDGRLTDRQGRAADFRHAIFIMTSNLGSRAPGQAGLGFGASSEPARAEIDRALAAAFRPEFLNRLDRVVVFRSLSEAVMREVLEKELAEALSRRGLRNRQWAVEWDATALDFLLAKGFSPALGARPLKRAIERYLLSPLAMAIVQHQTPEGDQFLFVGSDGDGVQVAFVDPDAPPAAPVQVETPTASSVRAVALDATGRPAEVALLEGAYRKLRGRLDGDAWRGAKQSALETVSDDGFWSSPHRFVILDRAESMDRVERGLETAGRLLRRLGHGQRKRASYPGPLVQRLAEQLYLLAAALADFEEKRTGEVILAIDAVTDARAMDAPQADAFAGQLVDMYRAWARKRRMHVEELEPADGSPARCVLAVAGFGPWRILAPEAGLHVLEVVEGGATKRHRARVRVAPPLDMSPPRDAREARRRAQQALARVDGTGSTIVRRYREAPSPLARDAIRGWRTGRLDRVWAGDFDLLEPTAAAATAAE